MSARPIPRVAPGLQPAMLFRVAVAVAIVALLLLSPNLIWLGTSTVRIENASDVPLDAVGYSACETTHHVGRLAPRQSVFRFLEACGDDSLEILVGDARFCRTYVEGELYHVDATIEGVGGVQCGHEDLLSSLFVTKVLW